MATRNVEGHYRFLDHAAEVKFQAFGKTIEEAFVSAGLALMQIYCEPMTLQVHDTRQLRVESDTLEGLLYDYLSQLVVMIDAEHFVVGDISDVFLTRDKNYVLTVVLHGQDSEDVAFDTDVKSITHHQMAIDQSDAGVSITVVVDV